MKIKIENVEPIVRGFPLLIEIGFAAEFWETQGLGAARVRATVRQAASGPVLWSGDTDDQTITLPGGGKLELHLPAGATAAMRPDHVRLDLTVGDGDAARAVPGHFLWPVDLRTPDNG